AIPSDINNAIAGALHGGESSVSRQFSIDPFLPVVLPQLALATDRIDVGSLEAVDCLAIEALRQAIVDARPLRDVIKPVNHATDSDRIGLARDLRHRAEASISRLLWRRLAILEDAASRL